MKKVKKVSYKGLFQLRENKRGWYDFQDKVIYLTEKHIGKFAVVNLTTKQVYNFSKSLKSAEHLLTTYLEGSYIYEWSMGYKEEYETALAKGEKISSFLKKKYKEAIDCYFTGDGLELVEITE